MEELFCIGCGAPIQTENKEGLGYTPQSALEKGLETGEVYCQRCFRLRHYNEITDVHLTDDDFLKLLHEVGDSDALVVNVVDIFDFNGSVIPGLPRFVVMVGDQLMTDIRAAHRAGIRSILVKPLVEHDSIKTQINRARERRVMKQMAEKYGPIVYKKGI